jgi:hypothetical protein
MKIYRQFSFVVFIIFLGWTIPAIPIISIFQVYNIFVFMTSDVTEFTIYSLLIIPPIAFALYLLLYGPVMRTFLPRLLWFRPLLVAMFISMLGLVGIVHMCFWASLSGDSVLMAALTGFVIWRVATALLFRFVPLQTFIPRPRS